MSNDETTLLTKSNRRYVVRRDGKLEPLTNCVDIGNAVARVEGEVCTGDVKEIDLYEYVGTYRPKRVAAKIDLFNDEPTPDA